MNIDKLADYGFLRTEIADAPGVPLDTARPEALMFEQDTLDLKAENVALKGKIEALEKRLAAPIEKAARQYLFNFPTGLFDPMLIKPWM